jgi:hypothetical protein
VRWEERKGVGVGEMDSLERIFLVFDLVRRCG